MYEKITYKIWRRSGTYFFIYMEVYMNREKSMLRLVVLTVFNIMVASLAYGNDASQEAKSSEPPYKSEYGLLDTSITFEFKSQQNDVDLKTSDIGGAFTLLKIYPSPSLALPINIGGSYLRNNTEQTDTQTRTSTVGLDIGIKYDGWEITTVRLRINVLA